MMQCLECKKLGKNVFQSSWCMFKQNHRPFLEKIWILS